MLKSRVPSLRLFVFCLLLTGALAGVAACGNPLDAVIPTDISRWDTDLRPSIDRLDPRDRQLAISYLTRMRAAATQSGQPVPEGVTVRRAIELEREVQRQQDAQRAQSLQAELQREEERIALEKRVAAEVLSITLVSKTFVQSDLTSRERRDQQVFTLELKNLGSRDIVEMEGTLRIMDWFRDEELRTMPFRYTERLAAGETVSWEGALVLNPFATVDLRIRNSDIKDFRVIFRPRLIRFADGTQITGM